MDALEDCFISHKDVGGFYAKEDKRHFAPFLSPPSSPSFDQHPTPSSTAVDSPPNVVSPRTPVSDQSTPVYTGTHLPQHTDDVKTSDASQKDDEGKSMNSDEDEDEDEDAEGEVDDGEWVPATQGGQLPSTTLGRYSVQHALPPSSPSPAVPQAYNATRLETSRTQPVIDDASNAHQNHSNAMYIARTDCADLPVNSIDARSDDSQRQVHCGHRLSHQPAVAGHGAAVVADATLDALNTVDVLNAGTHGDQENAGSFAPFTNFDIFSPDLPLNPSSWTATQPERHTDFSPAFSTPRRSPYSFREADLCSDNADNASSIPPSFGSQRGSGQMIFVPQYSDAAQQLWDNMYADQLFLPSGMQMTRAGLDRATSAGIFLPAGPLHNRRAPSGRSNYAAPPFVHARSVAPAGNAIQSSRDAQFCLTPMQWTSPSQFPAPSRPAKGKGKAITSDDKQGPSEHPRPITKLPSRPRNRTQASSRRTSAAAANVPPLEYRRQEVHHGRGQTQASAGTSRLPAYSSSMHAPTEIASTSRSATSAPYSYDSCSFASRSQLRGVPASSTTPALPTQQDYMTEFRVDLRAAFAPATAHTSDVIDCAWVGLDGRNVMKDNAMWEAVHEHLKMHKNEPFKGDYDPRGNLSLGPGNKLKKPKGVDDRATNPQPKPQNKNGCKAIPGQGKTSKKKSAKVYDDIKVELVRCRMQDPRTGNLCGIEKQHRAMAIHVCQEHYGMTVEKDKKRRYNMKVAEERAAKRARH
ncbi:hypothetical protein FB107DRAFT_294576 [Schizophyllum commune]